MELLARWLGAELNLETVMILKGSHLVANTYYHVLYGKMVFAISYYAVANTAGLVPGFRRERGGVLIFLGGGAGILPFRWKRSKTPARQVFEN